MCVAARRGVSRLILSTSADMMCHGMEADVHHAVVDDPSAL